VGGKVTASQRKFNGFLRRVAGEGVGVLHDFGRVGKSVERKELGRAAKDGADFAHLVGVASGNHDGRHMRTITASSFFRRRKRRVDQSEFGDKTDGLPFLRDDLNVRGSGSVWVG
jgi:hypothetical protein